jgi:hypothetical protein
MKKNLWIISTLALLAIPAHAAVHNLSSGQVFMGQEYLNEQPTGAICYVTVNDVASVETKGLYCSNIQITLGSLDPRVPRQMLSLGSRVTNFDTPSYQEGKRTCAAKLDGSIAGDEVFGSDTSVLYIPFYAGMHQDGGTEYDYFLTLSPDTKLPTDSRVHVMTWSTEDDIDCKALHRM